MASHYSCARLKAPADMLCRGHAFDSPRVFDQSSIRSQPQKAQRNILCTEETGQSRSNLPFQLPLPDLRTRGNPATPYRSVHAYPRPTWLSPAKPWGLVSPQWVCMSTWSRTPTFQMACENKPSTPSKRLGLVRLFHRVAL